MNVFDRTDWAANREMVIGIEMGKDGETRKKNWILDMRKETRNGVD